MSGRRRTDGLGLRLVSRTIQRYFIYAYDSVEQIDESMKVTNLFAMKNLILLSCLLTITAATLLKADDWPQWMGPERDNIWRETGILKKFPEGGLKIHWRKPIGLGYAGPAVVGGRVFVMDYQKASGKIENDPSNRNKLEGKERVLCYDSKSGELLWKHEYEQFYSISYAAGPRCTPTVADGKVYALGAEGRLTCLSAVDGEVVWEKNLGKAYNAATPMWGFSGHPLVDGDTLYCLVGGKGSISVALHKDTGEEKWRALSAGDSGYCPPVMMNRDGQKQLIVWHPSALNGLDPNTGKVAWTFPFKPSYNMSCTAPRIVGNKMYVSGIGNVAALFEINAGMTEIKPLWRGTPKSAVFCSNSTPFFDGKTIYGCDVDSSAIIAVRATDGERLWSSTTPTLGTSKASKRARHGTAFLTKNGQNFFIFAETGHLVLARLTPEKYEETSRFKLLEPTNEAFGRPVVWSHPAFAERCVFARNDKEIVCASLAAK